MRSTSLLLLVLCAATPAWAQGTPVSCDPLLSEAEIQSTCGVSDIVFEVSRDRESGCQISALREGTVSGLMVTVAVQDNAEAAQMSVEVARSLGHASDESRGTGGDTGEAGEALGQVFEMLGVQDAGAEEAQGVSDAEAATKELPGLGDGGVRYVSDATAGIGLVSHTIVFSSGALLVKLESGIVADRAGVCTAETLEPLARLVADRL
ncbi:MAG: hypothetical protein Rubg2KO_23790 [Rubricoccaceae bacterium]